MPFNKFMEKSSGGSNSGGARQDSAFLRFAEGRDFILRIRPIGLDSDGDFVTGVSFWRYWMNVNVGGRLVGRNLIVGFNSPIKEKMDEIGKDNEGYMKPSRRFYMNVLDRTLGKFNSQGNFYYATGVDRNRNPVYPTKCEITNEDLTNAPIVPHNKIMIMEGGPTIVDNIGQFDGRAMNSRTMKPAQVHEIDFLISRTGTGRDTKYPTMPHFNHDVLPDDLAMLDLFDIEAMARPLPDAALREILAGADYNEVLKGLGMNPGKYPTIPSMEKRAKEGNGAKAPDAEAPDAGERALVKDEDEVEVPF